MVRLRFSQALKVILARNSLCQSMSKPPNPLFQIWKRVGIARTRPARIGGEEPLHLGHTNGKQD